MRTFDLVPSNPPLLVWHDESGNARAAEALRWYDMWGVPMLILARKAPDCPFPPIKDEYNLIQVGAEGILIFQGAHFALAAPAFLGCYQPLSQHAANPRRVQYFPAPTWDGSVALARRVLATLGYVAPPASEMYQIRCQITGERIAGVEFRWLEREGGREDA
jgi:hypothetical protein